MARSGARGGRWSPNSDRVPHSSPSPLARPTIPVGYEPVARTDALVPGRLLTARAPDGEPICLVRHEGEIFALRDRCSHQAFPLSEGEVREGGLVECVWHGARFDCRTGRAVAGPASGRVPTYDVLVVDGWICIGERRP